MNNFVTLKDRRDYRKIADKFNVPSSIISRCLSFKVNSVRARTIRAFAVNELEADVYINHNELL